MEGKRMFYFCDTSSFMAHVDCAILPLTVKIVRQNHPLYPHLLSPIQLINSKVCQLCVNIVDMNYGVYYCSIYYFVAHLHCATSREDKEKEPTDHSVKTNIVEKTKPPKPDRIELAKEGTHFSHDQQHKLELGEKEIGIDQKCDACIRSIFPPFYSCAKCRFFLHKSCTELLPTKLRHPLH